MRRAGDEDALRRGVAATEAQLPSKSMSHPRGASSSVTVPSNGGFQSNGYSGVGTFFNGSFPSSAGTSFNGSFPSGATSFPYGGSGNGRGSRSPISPPTIVAPWGQDSRPLGGTTSNKFIDLDKDDCSDKGGTSVPTNDDVRTDKRLLWKEDEGCRLMSAWLKHSIDPRNGTNKNSEKY